jgi:nickel-dependent lactate racemase
MESFSPPKENLFCAIGSSTEFLSEEEIRKQVFHFLDSRGTREDVLLVPPDFTRFHSYAGQITQMICEYYNFIALSEHPFEKKLKLESPPSIQILPALGTHAPMTTEEIRKMYGEQLATKDPNPFLIHDWRNDVETIGYAPADMVKAATRGMVDKKWPAQLNRKVWEKRQFDSSKQKHKSLVISIGQVVPHEVMGMAK